VKIFPIVGRETTALGEAKMIKHNSLAAPVVILQRGKAELVLDTRQSAYECHVHD
jgi:hypothetical protein